MSSNEPTSDVGNGFDRHRASRLVFGTSLVAGVVQIALARELSAYHALSSVNLSIRLAESDAGIVAMLRQ